MINIKIDNMISNEDKRRYAYEKAIEAYWKHVNRYHIWMNYYAIFNGALFVGFCSLFTTTTKIEPKLENHIVLFLTNSYDYLLLIISIIGFISSICWILSVIGHEKWEQNWMNIIEYYENLSIDRKRVYSMLCTLKEDINPKMNKNGIIDSSHCFKNAFSTHFLTKTFIFFVLLGWFFLIVNSIKGMLLFNTIIGLILIIIAIIVIYRLFYSKIGFGNIYSNVCGKYWQEKK